MERLWFSPYALALLLFIVMAVAPSEAAEVKERSYDVPAGDATATLKQFAQQSGEQVVYLVDNVRGVQTQAIKGKFTTRGALERMLTGTVLRILQDEQNGALAVTRVSQAATAVGRAVHISIINFRCAISAGSTYRHHSSVERFGLKWRDETA